MGFFVWLAGVVGAVMILFVLVLESYSISLGDVVVGQMLADVGLLVLFVAAHLVLLIKHFVYYIII